MFAAQAAKFLKVRDVHYGWVIVAVTILTSLTTAGSIGVPGVLIQPLTQEFGWDTAQISSALALRLLIYGLMGPFSAALIERYGLRTIILSAITMIVVALISASRMTQVWHLVLLWGIVVGVGSGLTAVVLGTVVSTRWFSSRRGLVLGLLTASNATGQLIFLPTVAWLVERVGWRLSLVPSLTGLVLAGALVFLLMADRPSDVGLKRFGDDSAGASPALTSHHGGAVNRAFATLFDAARVPAFWILLGTFFICGTSTSGLVQTHFIPLCLDFGMASIPAASVLAMMGAFDIVGSIASGWLSDRFNNRYLLFWYYASRGLSLLYLPYSNFSIYGLSIFAMFYGLDWIATVAPTVRLTAKTFGREKTGIIFGWIFAAHQVGAAAAAFGAGYSRTLLLTYVPAYMFAGSLCLVAAAMILSFTNFRVPSRHALPA